MKVSNDKKAYCSKNLAGKRCEQLKNISTDFDALQAKVQYVSSFWGKKSHSVLQTSVLLVVIVYGPIWSHLRKT